MQTLAETRSQGPVELAPRPIDRRRAGLAAGMFLALWHAAWCGLVAVGLGQWLVDLVLWLHFLRMPIEVEPFAAGRALGLVAFTFAVGYALGWTFAAAWERYRGRTP